MPDSFAKTVSIHLLAGLGIYDIALIMDVLPWRVRQQVTYFRSNGVLDFWFKP